MGVYVKGTPKEGEYKLIKTTDGFVLDGKDIAYACTEIDLVRCGECKHYKREECRLDPFWERYTEPTDFCSKGERRTK